MSEQEARMRFVKIFMLIVEESPKWVVAFLQNKLYDKYQHRNINRFIDDNHVLSSKEKLKEICKAMTPPDAWDISALYIITMEGELLNPDECKTTGSKGNTVADLVDFLYQKRNTFAHSTNVSLDEEEYKDLLNDFKFVAGHFESINCVNPNTYKKAIDIVDSKLLTGVEVKKKVDRYQEYVKIVVQREILRDHRLIGWIIPGLLWYRY